MSASQLTDAISQLCPNCGLCCNGVLFADVELRAGDDAKRLTKLGLTLGEKGHGKLAFAQPCACFDGKLCGIYADRPKRCRTFECGLLKRVQDDGLEANAALKTISRTKRQVETVRGLLRQLGQKDEQLAMTKRYALAMSAPIDLSDHENDTERRGELMLAVDELMQQLQRDFLKQRPT
jgi:Fe-S-cluster containining protein